MSTPHHNVAAEATLSEIDRADLLYANNVAVVAEPGGLRLIFTRTPASGSASEERTPDEEVIARLVLPPLAARRLLRLLPGRLDRQQALAQEYARETEQETATDDRAAPAETAEPSQSDPFLVALAAAEDDDEPFTDEQRAAAREGWEAYRRGETVPWEQVRRELLEENEVSSAETS